jgi:DNA-binding beta-propeller fold protein YncE
MATKKKMLQAAAGAGGDIGAWDLDYAYYDDPAQWDITNSTYYRSLDVSTTDTSPRAIFFKSDGMKLYVLGFSSDRVYQFDLAYPFHLPGASMVASRYLGAVVPEALFFKPDGTAFYFIDTNTDQVRGYECSTAWDITTSSFGPNYFALGGSVRTGLFFKPDGTRMFTIDQFAKRIYEHELSTPWDLTTASAVQDVLFSTVTGNPQGISFKPDGTALYILDLNADAVREYSLSTPWDVSTNSYVGLFSVINEESAARDLFIDGGQMFICGTTAPASVYQYNIGGFSTAGEDILPRSVTFKPDGTKMFITGSSSDKVHEYSLATAWDTSTASSSASSFSLAADPYAIFFKPDGTAFFFLRTGVSINDYVYKYDLSTPWDVSTATYNSFRSVTDGDQLPTDIFFNPDGTKMFLLGDLGNDVTEYSLSTAWDISTLSLTQNASVASQDTSPQGFWFKPDGTKMFLAANAIDAIYEYDLSTAWDISTLSYSGKSLGVIRYDNGLSGVAFDEDGTKMFIVGLNSDKVHTFTLGVQE